MDDVSLSVTQKEFLMRDTASYGIYCTFDSQQDAINFARQRGGLPVFARDLLNRKGAKCYVVANYCTFLIEYAATAPSRRNFYEVLLSNQKTNAFLDVEFLESYNPDWTERKDSIVPLIEEKMVQHYEQHSLPKPGFFWAFSSVPGIRYSAHAVIFMLDYAFDGPETIGKFFSDFDLAPFACVVKGSTEGVGKAGYIIDRSVYTKNRAFRIPYSSKAADEDGPSKPILLPSFASASAKLSSTSEDPFPGLNEMLLQRNAARSKYLIADDPYSRELAKFSSGIEKKIGRSSSSSSSTTSTKIPSEFLPLSNNIADYIASEWNKLDPNAVVTPWGYLEDRERIMFSSSSRYCRQKGSEHKSNHIFFRADLKDGTFQQGCFDRQGDCADERAPADNENGASIEMLGGGTKRKREAASAEIDDEEGAADEHLTGAHVFTAWSESYHLPSEIIASAHKLIYAQVADADLEPKSGEVFF